MTATAAELEVRAALLELLTKAGDRLALAGVKVRRITTREVGDWTTFLAGIQVLVDDVPVYAATVGLTDQGAPIPLSRAGAWLVSGLRDRGLERLADQVENARPRAAS